MSIPFNQIPGDVRVPLFLAEVNAGEPTYSARSRALLIGRADLAVLPALTLTNAGSIDPSTLCGSGSMLAEMLLYAREVNRLGEIYVMSIADPVGGTAAVGSVTFTGTATRAAALHRYIGGEKYTVNVKPGDTATTIAARFRNVVNRGYVKFGRIMGAPVIATVDGTDPTKINLTARHSSSDGNQIRIYAGLRGEPSVGAGVAITVVQPTGGVGDGDIAPALAAIASERFDWIGSHYVSPGALDTVRDAMAARWDPLTSLDGHYITARSGTLSNQTTFGVTRNDPHTTIVALGPLYPHPDWCWVGALTGLVAFEKNLGRSLNEALPIVQPMQTLVLPGLIPPKDPLAIFTPAERDLLLRTGLSTIIFRADGQAACDRIITTYQINDAGLPDRTFYDIESVAVASYVKGYMKAALLGQYPRHVLREDNPNGIQGVATPAELAGCVIHAYEELAGAGLVRQADEFAQFLRVEADYVNDRANFYLPITKSAALRIFGVNITMYQELSPSFVQL